MSLFRRWFSRRKPRPSSRLLLERLEDRAVPANVFSLNQFEDNIRSYFEGNSVGFAYAINQNGAIVRHDGWGDARMEDDGQVDFTEDTRMTSASVAKTITATAILEILESDPGVSLGSSISPYLPSDWVQGPGISGITFRDLLTHNSGLRKTDWDGIGGADLNEQTSYGGLQQLIAQGITDLSDDDSNGLIDLKEQFSYENANFALMRVMTAYLLGDGDAADDAADPAQYTADYYVDYVSTEILDPMGISNADTATDEANPTLNYASPNGGAVWTYTDRTLFAGGEGWWMSADDYAKFMLGLRNNTVLTAGTTNLMRTQFLGLMDPEDWDGSIAVTGMFGPSYAHGGDLNNLHTAIMMFPNDVQAAVLVNSNWDPNEIPHGNAHQVELLQRAYDNAWTQLEIVGTAGPDTFIVRANANDNNAIDILLNGELVVTRWVETLDTLTLNGVGGNDTFEIRVLPAGIDLEIEGGSGNDDVHLGDDIADGPAQFDFFINGDINFDGGTGTDTLTFNDVNNYGNDTYTVTDSSIDKTVYAGIVTFADLEEVHLYTGLDNDTINVLESDAGTKLYIYSGNGDDTITLGNQNLSVNLGDSVFIEGGDDEDHVIFSDQNGAGPLDWYVFQTDHYSQSGSALIHYDEVENLTLQSTNLDSIVNIQGVADGVTLTINGRDGADTVRIHATGTNSSVIFNGGNHNDTLELTPDGGDLDSIAGSVTFTASSGTDEIIINDGNDAGADSYVLTSTTFDKSDFAMLTFSSVQAIELTANNSDNVINIFSVATALELSIYAQDGDDDFYISPIAGDLDSDINGDLYIHGGDGDDLLMLTDDGDLIGADSYTFSGNTFTKTGLADPWAYALIEEVILAANPQDNVITVTGGSAIDLTINAGVGNDTIHIGTGRADIVQADVHVDGGAGTDTIHINHEDAPYGHTYTFDSNTFDIATPFFGSLEWEDTTYVVLHAGDDNDTITVNSSPTDTQLSLFGNGGNDVFNIGSGDLDDIGGNVSLNGGLGADTATVNDAADLGNDTYTVTNTTLSKSGFTLTYFDLASLTLLANSGNNTINVNDTFASLSLAIEAGAGNDVLHLAPLTMNLAFIAGPVTFSGQSGSDSAYLHDENNGAGATYTLTKTTVTRPGFGGFTHATTEHVHLLMGNGNDTANVMDFSPSTTFHLFGRGGTDTFNLYVSPPMAGKGGGRVNVDGGTNGAMGDRLQVYYTGLPTIAHTPTLLVPGAGTADLTYLLDVLFSIGYTATESVKLFSV